MKYVIAVVLLATQMALAPAVGAHVIQSAGGNSRLEGFGSCAKGPCSKRSVWKTSVPHHHHGRLVVVGSNEHSKDCDVR